MTSDESGRHFRQLAVSRHSAGVLRIHFQLKWHRRTVYELMRALDLATASPDIQVIVLTGDFAARRDSNGPDPVALPQGQAKRRRQLATMATETDDLEEQTIHEKAVNFVLRSLAKKLLGQRKLLVALVEGECLGLGLSVCSLCDLVFATASARFQPEFAHLDPSAVVGPNWTLAHTRWLLLLGGQAEAEEARRCGLVAGVVTGPNAFWSRIEQYSRLPPASLLATKRLLLCPWREALLKELRLESTPLEVQKRYRARSNL